VSTAIHKNEAKALSPKAKTDAFMHEVVARATTFQRLLPRGMDPEWFVAEVRVAVARAPELLDCDKVSVIDALTTCAQLGLSPSGRLGSAYLLPFKDNRSNSVRCTLVIGYKGYVDLAYRSGDVMGFGAQVVHEDEPFEVTEGFDLAIHKHDRDVDNPGPLRAVYAWANLRGGYTVKVIMWAREVLAVKSRSRGANSGKSPWTTDEAEMWKKTAVRRLVKMLPLSPQKAQAFHKAQEVEDAEWDDAIDVTPEAETPTTGTAGLKNRLKASNGGQRIEETVDTRESLPLSHPDAEPPEPGSEG